MCKIHIVERLPGRLGQPSKEVQKAGRAQEGSLKIKLTKTVRDFSGSPYPKGSVLETWIAPDGKLEVAGAQHLPLYPHEWELVLTDKDLEWLLDG
jgi:hypothetical protein